MNISFEIPKQIEPLAREGGADPNVDAREAYLVGLYQRDKVSLHQLAEALGVSRYDAEGVLKGYGVGLESSVDELRVEGEFLRTVRPE